MPNIGDRVYVRPRPGHQVQRGAGLYGQFLPDDGMEVLWDEFHQARANDGSMLVGQAPAAPAPAPVADPAPAADEVS